MNKELRISLKLTKGNEWIVSALEKEMKAQCRPSINNMIESILVSYFKGQKIKNKTKK